MDREDIGVLGLEAIVLGGLDAIIFCLWRFTVLMFLAGFVYLFR